MHEDLVHQSHGLNSSSYCVCFTDSRGAEVKKKKSVSHYAIKSLIRDGLLLQFLCRSGCA